MTNRDDPGRGGRSAKRPVFEPADRELVAWALNAVAPLLEEGLLSSELLHIAREALHDYARRRAEVGDPRAYLVDAILQKARRSPQQQERIPNLLDLIAMKEVDTLPADVRKALHLIYVRKKTLEQVAEELGVSVADVKGMVGRAIDRLREVWWKTKP